MPNQLDQLHSLVFGSLDAPTVALNDNESNRQIVCGNPSCPLTTGDGNLLKCSRCKFRHYCSTICQSAHWPAHKDECAVMTADFDDPAAIFDVKAKTQFRHFIDRYSRFFKLYAMVLASNDFPGTSGNPYQPTFWQSHRLKVDLMGRTDASNAPRTIRVERVYIVDAIGYEQRVGWGLWVDYTLKYIRCANILSDGVEFDRVIQNLTIHGDPQQTEQVLQLAYRFGAADWATIKERVMRAVDGINNQI